jgi:hypothetical protein
MNFYVFTYKYEAKFFFENANNVFKHEFLMHMSLVLCEIHNAASLR